MRRRSSPRPDRAAFAKSVGRARPHRSPDARRQTSRRGVGPGSARCPLCSQRLRLPIPPRAAATRRRPGRLCAAAARSRSTYGVRRSTANLRDWLDNRYGANPRAPRRTLPTKRPRPKPRRVFERQERRRACRNCGARPRPPCCVPARRPRSASVRARSTSPRSAEPRRYRGSSRGTARPRKAPRRGPARR